MKFKVMKYMLLGFCAILLIGCGKDEDVVVKGGTVQSGAKESTKDSSGGSGKPGLEDRVVGGEPEADQLSELDPIAESNIKKIGEKIESTSMLWNVEFQVLSCEVTKEYKGKTFGKEEKEKLKSLDIETDEKGNLTDENAWIWLEIEVHNIGKETMWDLNQYSIVKITNDLCLNQVMDRKVYIDGVQGGEKESAYWITLKEDETKKYLVGFLINKEEQKEDLGVFIGRDRRQPSEKDFVFRISE